MEEEVHPKKEYPPYELVNSGKEAAIYSRPGTGVVHKFWRQGWILANYPMFDSKGRLFKQAAKRAAEEFQSQTHDAELRQKKDHVHRGIPIEQFSKITFILSKVSEDIINRARRAGILAPTIARAINHPFKPLYVLELSDLSKEGHKIISGNELKAEHSRNPIRNFKEIMEAIEKDKAKLGQLGYKEDIENHPINSAWLIRINEKTREAERFLWDATNLRRK